MSSAEWSGDQLINTIHFHSSLSSSSVCSTKHFGMAQRFFFLVVSDKYCKFNILQAKLDKSTFDFPQLTDEVEYTKYFECLSTFMTESFNLKHLITQSHVYQKMLKGSFLCKILFQDHVNYFPLKKVLSLILHFNLGLSPHD